VGVPRRAVISEDFHGRFGWHNLRHSLATFFGAKQDVNLATIQTMMRHAKPSTTARYLRVNPSHLDAQDKFLAAIRIAPDQEKLG